MKAIAIIQDEHRAITAVIEGLRHLLEEIASGRMATDHTLLRALFGYIEQFPERLHHPKEDEFLFAKLRLRRPDAAPLLDALSREHEIGRERFTDLKAAYEGFAADPSTLACVRRARRALRALPLEAHAARGGRGDADGAAGAAAGGLGGDRRGVRAPTTTPSSGCPRRRPSASCSGAWWPRCRRPTASVRRPRGEADAGRACPVALQFGAGGVTAPCLRKRRRPAPKT